MAAPAVVPKAPVTVPPAPEDHGDVRRLGQRHGDLDGAGDRRQPDHRLPAAQRHQDAQRRAPRSARRPSPAWPRTPRCGSAYAPRTPSAGAPRPTRRTSPPSGSRLWAVSPWVVEQRAKRAISRDHPVPRVSDTRRQANRHEPPIPTGRRLRWGATPLQRDSDGSRRGYVAEVRRLLLRLELVDYVAIAVFVVAVGYTAWVAWDVTASGPDTASVEALPTTPSEQVAAPDEAVEPPPLGPFRAAASSASTILVVGDSTGAGTGAWVDLVAQDLGAERVVTLHQWDEQAEEFPDGRRPTATGSPARHLEPQLPGSRPRLSRAPGGPAAARRRAARHRPRPLSEGRGARRNRDGGRHRRAVGRRPDRLHPAEPVRGGRGDAAAPSRAPAHRFAAEYGDPVIDVYTAFQRLVLLRHSSTTSPGRPATASGSGPTWWIAPWVSPPRSRRHGIAYGDAHGP